MDPVNTATVVSPDGRMTVTLETHAEHHMGANTVFIQTQPAINGVARFQTTNGSAFFTSDGAGLFVHDACVIVYVRLGDGQVFSLEHPTPWYFAKVRIESGKLWAGLYNGSGAWRVFDPIPVESIADRFSPGFGPVIQGRFPSAYG